MTEMRNHRVNAGDLLPGDRLVARWQDGERVPIKGKQPSVVASVETLDGRTVVELGTGEHFSCPPTLVYSVDREV